MHKLSKLRNEISSFPYSILDLPILTEHSSFSPRKIISKLPFISFTIIKPHLSKALHFSTSKLPFIFCPICTETHKSSCSFIVIVLPITVIDQIRVTIVKLTLSIHFSFFPITYIIATICIDIFSSSVSKIIFILALIAITVSINLTYFNLWPILGNQSALHSFRITRCGKWIEDF